MESKIQLRSQIKFSYYIFVSAVVIASIGVIYLLAMFASSEKQRDLDNWNNKLSLIADTKAESVNNWLKGKLDTLQSLAENTSLQLYMSELAQNNGLRSGIVDEAFQAVYLRNLITITAERGSFHAKTSLDEINANIKNISGTGIALYDESFNPIVRTAGFPAEDPRLLEFLNSNTGTKPTISSVYNDMNDQAVLAFKIPVFKVQDDLTEANIIGYITATTLLNQELYPILEKSSSTEKSLETILVESNQSDSTIKFISPLNNDNKLAYRIQSLSNDQVASVYASNHLNKVAIKNDYQNNEVLITGRKILYAPWILISKIDTSEAFTVSTLRRRNAVFIGTFLITVIGLSIIAVTQNSSARRYKKLAAKFESQERLLQLIADSKPEAMYIVDNDNKLHFCNAEALRGTNIKPNSIKNKKLVDLIGAEKSAKYTKMNKIALDQKSMISTTHKADANGRIIQSKHIPLKTIPSPEIKGSAVLVLEQDITEAITKHQLYEKTLNKMVDTLLKILDSQNTIAANHSKYVAEIASYIASNMQLDEKEVETIEIAAKLMNLGKSFVPKDLLTKKQGLTESERKDMYHSIESSLSLLKDIEFEGPVLDTIAQCFEQPNGEGPLAMKGAKILKTAHVIKIANAFISLLSDRSYRKGMNVEQAIETLELETKNGKFDKAAFAALVNYLENHGGNQYWKEDRLKAA